MISTLSTLSLALNTVIMFNPELIHSYLVCVGKEEVFRSSISLYFLHLHFVFLSYNQTDFFANPGPSGIEFKGAVWQPTRAFYNLINWSMFILVPIFYRAIFKFRRVQDLTAGKT